MSQTTSTEISADVREFFAEFERTSNHPDPDVVGEQFAPTFLTGDPNGIVPVPRAAFLATLPRRPDPLPARASPVRLIGLEQTDLDRHYLLVRTEWLAAVGPGGPDRPLTSTFLLHRDPGGRLTIAVYLKHTE